MESIAIRRYRKCLVLLFSLLFVAICSQVVAQQKKHIETDEGCTSIMVGRLASTDGSVMVGHTCDGNYRTWLNIVPHKKHDKGAMKKIYWGNLHTEFVTDMRGKILKGEVPDAEETYSYVNVAYPSLNEKQLAFGETTINGRDELRNDEGWFLIEELQAIALERCTTAREAIKLMGSLATKYGYGDWGECLTVADTKEVWQFEIFGGGPAEKGSVWAAVRIPDDNIGVSANIPRISEVNPKDPDHSMASDNVFSLAKEMGWWDGKAPFKFWKAYSGRKPFSTRELYVFKSFAPSLNISMDSDELPFSIKPEKKVSLQDVLKMYRETYEGTDNDMLKNLMVPRFQRSREEIVKDSIAGKAPEMVKSPLGNPWMSRELMTLLNTLKPGTVMPTRTIAIARCSYSQVVQLRGWLPDEIGGVAWFSFDNPAQSPRFPIFAGALELPKSFEVCGQQRYREDAATWWFRRANRLATIMWGRTRPIMEKAAVELEQKGLSDLPMLEQRVQEMLKADGSEAGHQKAREFLTTYTNTTARAAMVRWWELGDQFWGFFSGGF
jgi:dipeptidase